jgi:hypothetical protein
MTARRRSHCGSYSLARALTEPTQQLRGVTADVLTLARELRKGTIERVLGMSDLELGIQAVLTNWSSGRR